MRSTLLAIGLGVLAACGSGGGGSSHGGGGGSTLLLAIFNEPWAVSQVDCTPNYDFPPESIIAYEVVTTSDGRSLTGLVDLTTPIPPSNPGFPATVSLPSLGLYRLRATYASGTVSAGCDGLFEVKAGDTSETVILRTPIH